MHRPNLTPERVVRQDWPEVFRLGLVLSVCLALPVNVATSLYNRAISPRSPQGATAGIFILKTQAGAVGASWVDKIRVDIPGLNDNFAERLAKALTAKAHAKAQR